MAAVQATRTLAQMLTQAATILTARSTDARLLAAEKTLITNGLATITTNQGRISGNTVPASQRNNFRTQLTTLATNLWPAERRAGLRAVDHYDAIDLLFDCAAAGGAGLSSVTSTLGDPAA